MRDGQYRYGQASKQFSDDIIAMCTQLIERNQHPGLLISDREFTPFSLKTMIFCSQNGKNTAEFAALAGAKNFASFFFVPVRDRSNNSYLIAAASRARKLSKKEMRLVHSYCLDAIAHMDSEFLTDSRKRLLTEREIECLVLSGRGLTEKMAAEKLSISPLTVRSHLRNIQRKLGASNKIQTIIRGLELGEITTWDVAVPIQD